MTDAGWYTDPDDATQLRWWDGEQWTEHRQPSEPAPAPAGGSDTLVHVPEGKGSRSELIATRDTITLQGSTFAFAELTAVRWTAVRSHLNGAYQGTHFTIGVKAGDRKGDYGMGTNHKDERLEEFRQAYGAVIDLLHPVCVRLADDMAIRLHAGETITLGPAGARVELTKEGYRLKKPFSKVVPWSEIEGTEMDGGRVFFLIRKKPGAEPKRHSMVGLEGDNIVVLPYLLQRMQNG